jgi:PST family polysaccharide transporter
MSQSSGELARGAAWAAADNWIQQGFGLVSFIVIGSMVGPRIYGLMALGMTYHLLFASVLRDTYGEALIQRRTIERAHFDTMFWTLLVLGSALMLVSFALAGPVAALFQEPELIAVICVLGLTFPLVGASNFYRSMLRRALNFRALAIRSAFAGGISAVLAIVLAARGFGIWSLLAYQLALYGLDLLALAVQSRWRPRFSFSTSHYRDLADFSYKTMGNYVLANLGSQIDRFLIGYFLGTQAVGLYSMARRIVDGIDQTVIGVINAIALPTFARVQHDLVELKRLLYGATHFSMLIACPAYGGLGIIAPKLIAVVLPPEWQAAAPVLVILCFSGFFFAALIFLAACQRAIGQAGLLLALALATMIVRVLFSLAAVLMGFGMIGVVIALAGSTVIMIPIRVHFAKRAIGVGWRDYAAAMGAPLAATLAMIAIVYGVERLLDPLLPALPVLLAMIATGFLSYSGVLYLLSPHTLAQIPAAFREKRVPD